MNPFRISVIAQNVFREVIRDRVLYLVGAFAIFLLLAAQILPEAASIAADKIFLDLGLASIALLGLMVTIFVGYSIIQKTGTLTYYNTRIVKTGIGVKCVGPTHEYYDFPVGSAAQLDTLCILIS